MSCHEQPPKEQNFTEQLIESLMGNAPPEAIEGLRQNFSAGLENLYAVAYNYYEHGKYQKATDVFRVLTGLDSQNTTYWMGFAAALQMLQQYEKALSAYSVAALLDPQNPAVHFHAAGCCFMLGEVERGLQALDAAEMVAQGKENYETFIAQLVLIKQAWTS